MGEGRRKTTVDTKDLSCNNCCNRKLSIVRRIYTRG
jgi:hypothetical protein